MAPCHVKDIKSEHIDVGGVETHIIQFGKLLPFESKEEKHQYLFLIIPGNPGIPEYYEEFMHTLWEKGGEQYPVWCVGHAGHVTGPRHANLRWSDVVRRPSKTYTLQGQIQHKVAFIREYIPNDVTLVLIGHSIGCYIILNILPEILPVYSVLRCFMLFPTVERMAETPNGRIFMPALTYFRWLLTSLVKVLAYLGPSVHRKMVRYHFSDCSVPDCGIEATLNLFNPVCVNHSTFMAKEEMWAVGELQESLLKKYIDKMSFYYGAHDRWCPTEYCHRMQARFSTADIRLCQMDFSHAFVLDAGEEMAHLVWDWVIEHIQSQPIHCSTGLSTSLS